MPGASRRAGHRRFRGGGSTLPRHRGAVGEQQGTVPEDPKATGQGIVFVIEEWARGKGFDLSQATYSVQGFGNVGSWAARLLDRHGARCVAVSDHAGTVENGAGIHVERLAEWIRKNHSVDGFPEARPLPREDFWKVPVDILFPAALESQITPQVASGIQARLIAEGANGPTTPEAEGTLAARGVEILPDVLANAGGVIVSFFEWSQNKNNEHWDLEQVDARLQRQILRGYQALKTLLGEDTLIITTDSMVERVTQRVDAYCQEAASG